MSCKDRGRARRLPIARVPPRARSAVRLGVAVALAVMSSCRPEKAPTAAPMAVEPASQPPADPLVQRVRAYLDAEAVEPWPVPQGVALWTTLARAQKTALWQLQLELLGRLAHVGAAVHESLGTAVWRAGYERSEGDPRAYLTYQWAAALHNDERFADALALLAAARRGAPESYALLYDLRGVLSAYELGDDALAQSLLARAEAWVRAQPAPAAQWIVDALGRHRGHLWLRQGFLDLAAEEFARIASAPGATSLSTLAVALAAGRYRAAAGMLREVEAGSRDPGSRLQLQLLGCAVARRLAEPVDSIAKRLLAIEDSPLATASVRRAVATELADLALGRGDFAEAERRLAPVLAWSRAHGFGGVRGGACALTWARLVRAQTSGSQSEADIDRRRECLALLRELWRQQLRRWRASPVRVGGAAFLQYSRRRDLLSALIDLEIAIDPKGGTDAALDHVLAGEACDSLARRMLGATAATATSADVRALCPEGGGLLVYVTATAASHLLACTHTRTTHFALGSDIELDDAVRDLYRELRGSDADLDAHTHRVLAWLLPASVRAHVAQWRSIGIVGRELLSKAPFEVLPDHDGRPLAQSRALFYLPSLQIGALLAARHRRGETRAVDRRAVAIVATDPDPDARARFAIQPLAFDPEAAFATATGQLVGLDVVSGRAASSDVLHAMARGDCAYLYLLAHGVQDSQWQRPAGLALADGLLSCDAVEQLTPPPCVLLFSCGAGRASQRRGDSSGHHLGGAFLFAGAEVVGLADDDVELGESLALLRAFHTALVTGGGSPAEALRQARVVEAQERRRPGPGVRLFRLEGMAAALPR